MQMIYLRKEEQDILHKIINSVLNPEEIHITDTEKGILSEINKKID